MIDIGAGTVSFLFFSSGSGRRLLRWSRGHALTSSTKIYKPTIFPSMRYVFLRSTSLDAIPVDRSSFGFIKIDVDGGELDVLRSGMRLKNFNIALRSLRTRGGERLYQK
jgi:hypothetical protein